MRIFSRLVRVRVWFEVIEVVLYYIGWVRLGRLWVELEDFFFYLDGLVGMGEGYYFRRIGGRFWFF